jgi:hypothetical protein
MASAPNPLPQPSFAWSGSGGRPSQAFAQYMATLDAAVRALVGGVFGKPTPLVNAPNDTAAAAAGVQVGALYRNGSQVLIRVA